MKKQIQVQTCVWLAPDEVPTHTPGDLNIETLSIPELDRDLTATQNIPRIGESISLGGYKLPDSGKLPHDVYFPDCAIVIDVTHNPIGHTVDLQLQTVACREHLDRLKYKEKDSQQSTGERLKPHSQCRRAIR
jgi:hypothetical protein